MKRSALLLATFVMLAAGSAFAEVKNHAKAKVSLDVPSAWKVGGSGDVMTLTDPAEEIGFVLVVSEGADLKKVIQGLDKDLAKIVTGIKWAGKLSPITLNGMKALANKGSGKGKGDRDVDVALLLVETPANKVLLVVGLVDAARKDAHKDEAKRFLASIKPL